ncbi:M48 family metallopeptidase [Emticicia fluvialis]|uniref:M48 family metallopeptidase n=1 Tax=Emticicia fluvialis TaxID=2974474 RepID=UPI002166A05F|nr:M48 family metallopeptidase [Emticicia fluvialis]
MQYTATYYDGQTSRPHQVQVEVWGNSLRINDANINIVWAITEIEFSAFMGKGKTMLQYGAFPHQHLEFPSDSPLAIALKAYLPGLSGKPTKEVRQYEAFLKAALIMAGVAAGLLLALYYWLLPVVVSFVVSKIPVSAEVAIGEKFYQGLMGNARVDKKATAALTGFAGCIDFETKYPLRFTVVENKDVNAFALPGGHVVVYSGIIDKLKTPEELAALLAHEVTHIKERHSLNALTRSMAGSVLLSFVFGDDGTLANLLLSKADEIHQLGFSRSMEKEADLKGLQLMANNHLDTQGMLRLMQRLQAQENENRSKGVPAYLSSHPLTEERITYITEQPIPASQTRNKAIEEAWRLLK